jgi:hypothetical protein
MHDHAFSPMHMAHNLHHSPHGTSATPTVRSTLAVARAHDMGR